MPPMTLSYVVSSRSGPTSHTAATGTNVGDIITDNHGREWVVVSDDGRSGTLASAVRLYPDGTIR